MTAARWLFLDFDGVLHSAFPRADRTDAQNAHWAFLPTLAEVLRRHPTVEIVITSTWRIGRSLDALRGFFPEDLALRVVGTTPRHLDPHGPGARQAEVQAWLKAHDPAGQPWVAVDDMPDLYGPDACLIIAPDGFFAAEANALDAALTDPVTWANAHPVPPPATALWMPA